MNKKQSFLKEFSELLKKYDMYLNKDNKKTKNYITYYKNEKYIKKEKIPVSILELLNFATQFDKYVEITDNSDNILWSVINTNDSFKELELKDHKQLIKMFMKVHKDCPAYYRLRSSFIENCDYPSFYDINLFLNMSDKIGADYTNRTDVSLDKLDHVWDFTLYGRDQKKRVRILFDSKLKPVIIRIEGRDDLPVNIFND